MGTMTIVRDAGFARRLEQACDASPHCPPLHKGRLVWIVEQLKLRGIDITVQTVARWVNGEAKPRQDKNTKLAQILGVDSVWLYLGAQQNELRKSPASAATQAVVDAAAGLLEVHEAMGSGDSHNAIKLREALAVYRKAA